MERCICNQITEYIGPLIHPCQYVFLKGKSCTTQLIQVYDDIGKSLDNGGQIDIIYLDCKSL